MDVKDSTIGVIGDNEFVLGFQLAGIKKIYDSKKANIEDILTKENLDILILESKDVQNLPLRLKEKVESSVKPTTVIISETAEAEETLRKMIKKSIGVDLWNK